MLLYFGCSEQSLQSSPSLLQTTKSTPSILDHSVSSDQTVSKRSNDLERFQVKDIEIGRYGGRLTLAAFGNPKTFNPLFGNESSSSIYLSPMFADCWSFHNGRQEEEPGLCKSYERSEDGLTYIFTLRKGLRWSDGHPITSDDFVFSYRVILDPGIPNSDRDLFRQGTDKQGRPRYPELTKLDALRFQFKLHEPDVLFQNTGGSFAVIPKHVWQASYARGQLLKTMSTSMDLSKLVGSGPFIVREFERDKRVVMVRNAHYWKFDSRGNQLPYLDSVAFRICNDLSSALARFESNEIHVHDIRAVDYERLKRAEKTTNSTVIDLGPSFNTHYLMFNLGPYHDAQKKPYIDPVKQAWFNSKRFRAAISHAIDRNGIVRNVLSGRGQPLWSYISPANRRWYPTKVKTYEFDLEKAAEILAKDGFKKVDGHLLDKGGNKVVFSIATPAENDMRVAMMNVIKRDLSRLGITANIKPTPFNDIVHALRQTRHFEAVVLGWGTSSPPDPSFSRNVLLSSGQDHYWHPEQISPRTKWEARMDELIRLSTSTHDYGKRKAYSDEVFQIFSEFQPQIQLVVTNDAAAARNSVGNFRPSTLRPKTHWNIETLFLRK
ncbi:MAG: ABC transporter substrate-binding protein [Myxococcota bacterium]|nr:ABC transporter substrate-binding protein [Myxococcota bacterium]